MHIFPAIDLKDNKVVRLSQGDYDKVKIYGENPRQTAEEFCKTGATHLHIVDLDGAKEGRPLNFDSVKEIASVDGLFTEIGGGIRDEQRILDYLSLGIDRVILGTIAIQNFEFTKEMAKKYGDKIAVGVDAKDGMVAVNGWLEKTSVNAVEFCQQLFDVGVKTVIYTDISRDGMLVGCNMDAYRRLCDIKGLLVVASGGVSTLSEITELKQMGCDGAIVGKAIYEGKLNLPEVLEVAK